MYRKYLLLFMVLGLFYVQVSTAQKIIHGYIRDKKTGEPLPEANIQILGTFAGTISNDDGKYLLKLKNLPATILVSYIGYKSQKLTITEDSSAEQNISLVPTVIKFQPVVVTSEDPAVRIMREVIKRKKEWRSKLKTYKAEAYTRVTVENDTSIVFISESKSALFWGKKKGLREVIKSKRETANIPREANFALAIALPNLYNDDIDVMGYKVPGLTNPDAFHFYKFKLAGQKSLDGKTVFDISVIPKSKLQPTFVGHIFVLDEVYALIKVELKPSKSIILQPPIQGYTLHFKQQFSSFGQEFWFPVDVRVKGSIKIGFVGLDVPNIKYNQISRLSDYQVNIQLPDTLFEKKRAVIVDSISVKKDTSFASGPRVIPLTTRESKAYTSLDSTMTLEKAFKPTGFLAKLSRIQISSGEQEVDLSKKKKKSKNILAGFSPLFHYNRVDAFHLGFQYKRRFIQNFTYYFKTAYNTGLKRWSYGGGFRYYLDRKGRAVLEGNYSSGTNARYNSENYSSFLNTVYVLSGSGDYFDYYWNKKLHLFFRYRFDRINTQISIGYNNEKQSSVSKTTDFVLFGKNHFRPNPEIQAGRIRSLEGSLVIVSAESRNSGRTH